LAKNDEIHSKLSRDQLYNDALKLYKKGKLGDSEKILENLVTLDQEDLESWLYLGLIREDLEDFVGAIKVYSAILELDSDQSNIWMNLGIVYGKMKEYQKSEEALKIAMEVAIETGQPRAIIWNSYGVLCTETNRYEEAEKMFAIVLKLEPENKIAAKNLSEVRRLVRKDYVSSLDMEQVRQKITENHDCALSWYEYGLVLKREGLRIDAIDAFIKSIQIDSTNPWAHYDLAYTYYRNGCFEKARTYLQETVRLDRKNALFWSTLGTMNSLLGDIEKSEYAHLQAVTLDEWDGRYWSQLGNLYLKIGRLPEVEKISLKAIQVDPYLDMSWALRGSVLLEMNQFRESIEAFEKVLAISPGFVNAWSNIGLARYALGEIDKAIAAFYKSVETGPHHKQAWIDLVRLLHEANRHEEALRVIDEATNAGIFPSKKEGSSPLQEII
jgi:tetratricopeptide (TPR) repeat protein